MGAYAILTKELAIFFETRSEGCKKLSKSLKGHNSWPQIKIHCCGHQKSDFFLLQKAKALALRTKEIETELKSDR